MEIFLPSSANLVKEESMMKWQTNGRSKRAIKLHIWERTGLAWACLCSHWLEYSAIYYLLQTSCFSPLRLIFHILTLSHLSSSVQWELLTSCMQSAIIFLACAINDSINLIFIIKHLLRTSFKGPFSSACSAWLDFHKQLFLLQLRSQELMLHK